MDINVHSKNINLHSTDLLHRNIGSLRHRCPFPIGGQKKRKRENGQKKMPNSSKKFGPCFGRTYRLYVINFVNYNVFI
jgi:hypothetical protein